MNPSLAKLAEHSLVLDLKRQLNTTPRLRWMVYAVAMIFVCYLTLVLDDWRAESAQDFKRIAARSAKLDSLQEVEQASFESFLAAEREQNAALLGRFWKASSRGLAGAEFQSWLRYVATESRLEQVRLNLSELRPLQGVEPPLWQIKAELSGRIQPSDVRSLLDLLARSERAVTVEDLSYSPLRGDRFSMQLAADFIIEGAERVAER